MASPPDHMLLYDMTHMYRIIWMMSIHHSWQFYITMTFLYNYMPLYDMITQVILFEWSSYIFYGILDLIVAFTYVYAFISFEKHVTYYLNGSKHYL